MQWVIPNVERSKTPFGQLKTNVLMKDVVSPQKFWCCGQLTQPDPDPGPARLQFARADCTRSRCTLHSPGSSHLFEHFNPTGVTFNCTVGRAGGGGTPPPLSFYSLLIRLAHQTRMSYYFGPADYFSDGYLDGAAQGAMHSHNLGAGCADGQYCLSVRRAVWQVHTLPNLRRAKAKSWASLCISECACL